MTTREGTYWHVAPASYEEGDDLLCWSELLNAGTVTDADWRWDHTPDAESVSLVSLWASKDDAAAWQAQHGGVLLAIEIDDRDAWRILDHSEGHPAAVERVPAYCITVAS